MAGASLALRATLQRPSYLSAAAGYLYAGTAMAGPWVLASVYIYVVQAIDLPTLTPAARAEFLATLVHAYCLSSLLSGAVQLAAARHVSDRIYVRDTRSVVPAAAGSTLLSVGLHLGAWGAFAAATRPPWDLAVAEAALFGTLAMVWNGMSFLGAIRNYLFVVASFAVGIGAGLIAGVQLALTHGLAGLLLGFALGQGLTWAMLHARIRAELPPAPRVSFGFLRTAAVHPSLPVIGLTYSAGLWIDKVIFWAGPYAERTELGLRSFAMYDNAVFYAYLTVVPALALLFIRIEVVFYEKYSGFYAAIRGGAVLSVIRERREAIEASFWLTLERLATLQGAVAILAMVLGPAVFAWLGIDWLQLHVFRVACVGALLHVLVMASLLTALHLAMYRIAAVMTSVYGAACALGTLATARLDLQWYGFGYVAAGFCALVVGLPLLVRKLRRLDYETFVFPKP